MSGIEHSEVRESVETVRAKLEDLKTRYEFKEPNRGDLADPSIEWRTGAPDYTRANYEYLKGKTQNHAKGLPIAAFHYQQESIIPNLIISFETALFQ